MLRPTSGVHEAGTGQGAYEDIAPSQRCFAVRRAPLRELGVLEPINIQTIKEKDLWNSQVQVREASE